MLVFIIRGIPGSGKSTYIRNMYPTAVVCSADHYFMKNGEYNWHQEDIAIAHLTCFEKFRDNLIPKPGILVVDNTNSRLWEMESYINLCKRYNFTFEVIRMNCSAETAFARQVHDVPLERLEQMNERMEDYLNETIVQTD